MNEAMRDAINQDLHEQIDRLINVGVALSSEKDTTKLLEQILFAARDLTHADGGTIYSVTDNAELKFETLINGTLDMYMGGTSGKPIPFPSIPLKIDSAPNLNALVAFAANKDIVVNIPDAYQPFDGFDMTAAREMDKKIGYRTQSVLTIPMKNHEGELNGVIQLINAQESTKDDSKNIIPFSAEIQRLVSSLASQAAVALTNRQLIDDMQRLFQSFTKVIAKSIDEKSPYTGGHCRRVPEITMLLANALNKNEQGPLADFNLSEADMYELNIAAWLHDCGKVGTPEYVMDKATKLETIIDRIELVEAKFEIKKRDFQIECANKINAAIKNNQFELIAEYEAERDAEIAKLETDFEFLANANVGGEFMPKDAQQRVAEIANQYQLVMANRTQPLLSDDEVLNLQIQKGTLNDEERLIINKHISITIDMLEALPFPKHLRNVPEYACGHHEKMDGSGYPRGLTRDEMSVPARMMAIADIFEALTANDRPYKPPKTLTQCLKILGFMKLDKHIDPDLFDIFVDHKVYEVFAAEFLDESQIDEVDVNNIPGYTPPEQR
ncbi:HD family phosphohydrolase [Catenovulum maritimum]|uniref:Phosphohydrolase n=1 Tax=Catenovulum maritimum TaxID=1513271 RepID=A0A0J8GY66_9ALTE|nr:HD family phosphohydrolase [Catenovulum maritimum]KMT66179.1 phosphohydrolase [Catenovulum maritimum]